MAGRTAAGGTLVLGGDFAGGYVARLLGKRGATRYRMLGQVATLGRDEGRRLVGVVAQRHFTQARDCAYPYVVFLMPHTASALGGRMPAAKPEFGSATARAVLLTAKSDIRPSDPSLPRKKSKLAAQVAMPLVPRLAEMK